ncbi:MAG: methylenetetrahydrofolate reductase [Thermoplasmatota archaeon]
MNKKSNLQQILEKGRFAVTAEISPPKGSDPEKIRGKASILHEYVDACNITDNQTAVVRMSSIAGCSLLLQIGLDPIMQLTCRDRNRIALQSDVLGASAMGIKNMLLLTGDHQSFGNHPEAKGVFDVDSIQLIEIVSHMKQKGIFQNGDKILAGNPNVFIGAAANPFANNPELSILRLVKKIKAGAQFIQTQSVFNIETFNSWMDEVRSQGLDKKIHIIAGITPLKSIKMAERMKFFVPGVDIPDYLYQQIIKSSNPQQEGKNIAIELMQTIKKMKGVHGIHITALFWEEIIPRLICDSGLCHR